MSKTVPKPANLMSPAALVLTHVCRHWRRISLGTPIIWTHIHMGHKCTPGRESLLHLWFTRAATAPLHVDVSHTVDGGPESCTRDPRLYALLAGYSHQFESFTGILPTPPQTFPIASTFDAPAIRTSQHPTGDQDDVQMDRHIPDFSRALSDFKLASPRLISPPLAVEPHIHLALAHIEPPAPLPVLQSYPCRIAFKPHRPPSLTIASPLPLPLPSTPLPFGLSATEPGWLKTHNTVTYTCFVWVLLALSPTTGSTPEFDGAPEDANDLEFFVSLQCDVLEVLEVELLGDRSLGTGTLWDFLDVNPHIRELTVSKLSVEQAIESSSTQLAPHFLPKLQELTVVPNPIKLVYAPISELLSARAATGQIDVSAPTSSRTLHKFSFRTPIMSCENPLFESKAAVAQVMRDIRGYKSTAPCTFQAEAPLGWALHMPLYSLDDVDDEI
ncbi:hypothetical protein C8F01DRAFT_1261020 [Mycena amicta]|nr:hypothetical protein C8F01DRAFT_1261020 [Mycena amicta]